MATSIQRGPRHSRRDSGRRPADGPLPIGTEDIRFTDIGATLFSDIAQEKARVIAQGRGRGGSINNSTQLRRFYDELVLWFDKVQMEQGTEARQIKYQELAPYIQMLVAKVAYARGRGHVDRNFETLYAHVIRQISDADSLRHAKLFMEAFMGFYKAEEKN